MESQLPLTKVLVVFGTRPEAIKMAPLVKEFLKHPNTFKCVVCVTGQHREMLDQVLALFDIKPHYDLNIMKRGQDLYDITSKILIGMRDVIRNETPDLILVHGDTSTSTTSALAAFYHQIPVGHVEAGLRTHNRYSPWPEETNRQITARLTHYHFAPTPLSKKNLLNEGIPSENIFVTGNTVIDALHSVINKIQTNIEVNTNITEILVKAGLSGERLNAWKKESEKIQSKAELNLQQCNKRKLVLITGHRRENFGQGFNNICEAIKLLSEQHPTVDFVYPMHLNPNVRNAIKSVFGNLKNSSNIFFIEPLDYLPFVFLMSIAYLILTDSGGIQEEAPGLGKPVLVMRDTTERPEAIEAGTVKLVGTNKQLITNQVSTLINNKEVYSLMSKANNPYGDGKACEKIIHALTKQQILT